MYDVADILKHSLPGVELEERPQQNAMAQAVRETLDEGGALLVEAGTGVGKSFAYLLPAMEAALSGNGPVVVSTHTIHLQEQLFQKDAPIIAKALATKTGKQASLALLKGRGNYLSRRRLQYALANGLQLDLSGGSRGESLERLDEWTRKTVDGTYASVDFPLSPEVWSELKSDPFHCMGSRCATFRECFYQVARRNAAQADVIFVNHALLLSDLALRMDGAPGILPEYKSLIVDEAHHLPGVAADHLATGVSLSEFHHLVKRLLYADESSKEERRGGLFSVAPVEGAGEAVMAMKKAADRFYESLGVNPRDPSRPFVMPDPPPDITEVAEPVSRVIELLDQAKLTAKTEEVSLEVEGTRQECREIIRRLSFVLDQAYGDDSCYVVETDPYSVRRGFPRAGAVKAVPLDPSDLLREHLVASLRSIIFTSATLSVASDFNYFQHALGLEQDGGAALKVRTLQLGSPFDFKKQVVLYLPRKMPHPRREEAEYTRAVTEYVKASVRASHGKAFVLFTSFRMMREVAAGVRPLLENLKITFLMQGEEGWDRTRLLNTFREDVDSVLFGVSSFWEGVDVPGESLSNLIITKLPFTVPEGPVVEARHRRLKQEGKEPFAVESLPEAVLRLKQGFGRLIRTSQDRGTVTLLDPRVTSERWGHVFLKALPECDVRYLDGPGDYARKPGPKDRGERKGKNRARKVSSS